MQSGPQGVPGRPRVIFIRGITTRSGTNYLSDLMALHPQCDHARRPIWEDFSLDDADQLERYVARLSRRWPAHWEVPVGDIRAQLLREFGDGLVRTLVAHPERPGTVTIAKSPSVRGLEHFFAMFPGDPLLVLVRDGRSVVESMMRSFGQSFDRAARDWAAGADAVLRFRSRHLSSEGTRWLLLRYEDIVLDVRLAIRRIADIADLDPDAIDLSAATALPVRGSSSFQRDDGDVHWRGVPQDESFKPLERASTWDEERHRRFNWIAGEQMVELGYSLTGSATSDLADRIRYQPRDLFYAMDRIRYEPRNMLHAVEAAAGRVRRRWAGSDRTTARQR